MPAFIIDGSHRVTDRRVVYRMDATCPQDAINRFKRAHPNFWCLNVDYLYHGTTNLESYIANYVDSIQDVPWFNHNGFF